MRVILDTDLGLGQPGTEIDDGFALALLIGGGQLELEMLTTVNGNTDVETATYLSVDLLERLGRPDVPVYQGAAAPLIEPHRARNAPQDMVDQYGHRKPAGGLAAARIAEAVLASPGEITIIAIGPLTNVAAAINLDPAVARAVKEIVVMGGVFEGHTNRTAMPGEFNFWVDPHAAQAVLLSGAAVRLVGLDVTLQVLLTREHARQLDASGSDFGTFAARYTDAWLDHLEREAPGDPDAGKACAMHDPLAVAALTHPELLTWKPAHVEVVTADAVGRGVCVADFLVTDNPPPVNAQVATAVDAAAFMDHFIATLSTLK